MIDRKAYFKKSQNFFFMLSVVQSVSVSGPAVYYMDYFIITSLISF